MRTLATSLFAALGFVTAPFAAGCSSSPEPKAEATAVALEGHRVVHGPVFLLANGAEARALTVDPRGVIQAVHATLEDAPPLPREVLPGALAMAGLHDAHLHVLGMGMNEDRADLRGASSTADVVSRMQAFAKDRPAAAVLYGRGWDQSLFPGQAFPSAADLSALGDRPVILTRVDGHAIWVNNKTLSLARLTRETADPAGGSLHRDAAGQPTGILLDNAMGLVRTWLPSPSDEDLDRWLLRGLEVCADAGLVAVHDMGLPVRAFERLQHLDAHRTLPVRVFVYLDSADEGAFATLRAAPAAGPRVTLLGLKLFADGAMGSRGAALLSDYTDEPGNQGLLITDKAAMSEQVRTVHEAGGQVAVHAIGDRGVRTTLNAIAAGQGEDRSRRHRVEHAQMIAPEDFARFKGLGVVASMQPTHATSDMRWAEARVGPQRVKGTYAWSTLRQAGVPLAFGSDAPVESHRPAWGIYAALTRQDHQGSPEGGWYADQRLGLHEVLDAFSAGAAYAIHREGELGVIAPGAQFDLTIWPEDFREAPLRWIDAVPTATVVGGRLRVGSKPSKSIE